MSEEKLKTWGELESYIEELNKKIEKAEKEGDEKLAKELKLTKIYTLLPLQV